VPAQPPSAAVVRVVAVVLVAALQWWRSNALLSIFAGTAFYVLAVNVLVR
jgi:branched-subunit amino acid transport protein AzlD